MVARQQNHESDNGLRLFSLIGCSYASVPACRIFFDSKDLDEGSFGPRGASYYADRAGRSSEGHCEAVGYPSVIRRKFHGASQVQVGSQNEGGPCSLRYEDAHSGLNNASGSALVGRCVHTARSATGHQHG